MPKVLSHSVSIHDCRVEAIASTGGGGGQNKNRRHTAIRITHPPSGAVGYSADERQQLQNKVTAFRRMAESKEFQQWTRIEASRRSGQKTVDMIVDEMLDSSMLKIEGKDADGRWTTLSSDVPVLPEG